MEPQVTVGVVAVVERAGRYLLIRRAAGVVAPGAWCFVGGAVEPGETQAAAAVREFREEVGGEIRPVRSLWEYVRPDGRLRLHYWEAELIGGPLRANPAEVAEIGWYTAAEIEALPDVLASNIAFVRALRSGRE